MFGLGMGEIILIAVIALIALGPDKLPQAAKTISKGIRDLRKGTRDLRHTIEQDSDLGSAVREIRSALHDDPLRPVTAAKPVAAAGSLPRAEVAKKADPELAQESPPETQRLNDQNPVDPTEGADKAAETGESHDKGVTS